MSPMTESIAAAQAEHDHRVRVVQSKVETFVKACGGSVPLHALRMYIETQERSDAIISRALTAPAAPFQMGRSGDGTPTISLVAS